MATLNRYGSAIPKSPSSFMLLGAHKGSDALICRRIGMSGRIFFHEKQLEMAIDDVRLLRTSIWPETLRPQQAARR